MDKVRVIESSLRCFVWSWFSLIPILGLMPSCMAVSEYLQAKRLSEGQWNPARKYLQAGLWLAIIGGLVSGAVGLIFTGVILRKIADGSISPFDFFH